MFYPFFIAVILTFSNCFADFQEKFVQADGAELLKYQGSKSVGDFQKCYFYEAFRHVS